MNFISRFHPLLPLSFLDKVRNVERKMIEVAKEWRRDGESARARLSLIFDLGQEGFDREGPDDEQRAEERAGREREGDERNDP